MHKVFELFARMDASLRAWFLQPNVAYNALLVVVLAAHGYEIFNLHLTIDEEIHIADGRVAMSWIAQGRWGMGLASLLLPSSVAPFVSTALGIGLLAVSLWIIVVRSFGADRYAGFCAVAVAVSLPTLPFTLTFATLAYGVGFASLAAAGFIAWSRGEKLRTLVCSMLAGAFAISVYQPMLFALAALFVAGLCRPGFFKTPRHRLRGVLALAGSLIAYLLVDRIVRGLLHSEVQYVDQFVDVKGLIADPLERLRDSVNRAASIYRVSERHFALHSPWMLAFLLAAVAVAFKPSKHAQGPARFAPALAAVCLLLIPIGAELLTAHGVPLRSGLYYPFVVALLAAAAFANSGPAARTTLAVLASLTVMTNAVIDNRLYAAAHFAYERDRLLAHDIMREAAALAGADSRGSALRLEVVGSMPWPDSTLVPRRETIGASFFEWDEGNRFRVARFLTMLGFPSDAVTEEERLALVAIGVQMPSWPKPGWVRRENDLLVVKLSDYTPTQRRALCAAGATQLCR